VRGAEGLRLINQGAAHLFSSLTFDIQDRVFTDRGWAITWEAHGTHRASGKSFSFRGASVGTVAADGKVAAHTDFWNAGLLEAQVGSLAG
jgi:SnoaL-like protein